MATQSDQPDDGSGGTGAENDARNENQEGHAALLAPGGRYPRTRRDPSKEKT